VHCACTAMVAIACLPETSALPLGGSVASSG
jgi:hypothetical protein